MGIFDVFKSKKEEKLPLIARVDLAKVHEERVNNQELGEVSILARKDYTKKLEKKIRVSFVAFDYGVGYGVHKPKIRIIYGRTCDYRLPKGMELKDAYKVVSYLSEMVDKKIDAPAISESNVENFACILQDYGFKKDEKYKPDFSHYQEMIDDVYPIQNISVEKTFSLPQSKDVDELLFFDGDLEFFVRSDMCEKNIDWFVPNVTYKDVKKIYSELGLQIDKKGIVEPIGSKVK